VISAKNMSHSSHLEARDQLKQVFWDVRLMGIMGSKSCSYVRVQAVTRVSWFSSADGVPVLHPIAAIGTRTTFGADRSTAIVV